MAMVRINDLPPAEDPRRSQRTDARRARETRQPESGRQSNEVSDSVDVSADARQAGALQDRLTEAARNTPDVRQDRVAEAKQKLRAGAYDSDQVKGAIADRLLEQFIGE